MSKPDHYIDYTENMDTFLTILIGKSQIVVAFQQNNWNQFALTFFLNLEGNPILISATLSYVSKKYDIKTALISQTYLNSELRWEDIKEVRFGMHYH